MGGFPTTDRMEFIPIPQKWKEPEFWNLSKDPRAAPKAGISLSQHLGKGYRG